MALSNAPGSWNRAAAAVFSLLLTLYVGMILYFRVIPTNDGPVWLYYGAVTRDLLDGVPGAYAAFFELDHIFTPHSFGLNFLTAVMRLVEPLTAELALNLIFLIWSCLSFCYLVNSVAGRRHWPLALAAFPLALHYMFYMAFIDYNFGLATALFACGYWLRFFDRLNVARVAILYALLTLLVFMHQVATFHLLTFIAVHLACVFGGTFFRHAGGLAARFRQVIHKWWVPAFCSLSLCVLTLFLVPLSPAKEPITYTTVLSRVRDLATARPLSPYESRSYRMALMAITVVAAWLALRALWIRRKQLSERGEWCLVILTAVSFLMYLVVPDSIAGGDYFPPRFAIFGLYVLTAGAALYPSSSRVWGPVAVLAAAVSMFCLAYQFRATALLTTDWDVLLDTPPLRQARLGAVVQEGDRSQLRIYDSNGWAGAHYLRRSKTAMLNAPWVEDRGYFRVRQQLPCLDKNPGPMLTCLEISAGAPNRPELDVLIGSLTGTANAADMPKAARVAQLYGLTHRLAAAPGIVIYTRPAGISQETVVNSTHSAKVGHLSTPSRNVLF